MKWIKVSDRMPDHGKTVLATYKNSHGKNRIIVGYYLERWTEESDNEDDCNDEYYEKLDKYFYKSGWYEQQDNWWDYASIYVHEGKVTHWMPLPQFPN